MTEKKYFVGVDWASDPPFVSMSLVDAIICDQKVKQRIEEALKGDMAVLTDAAEKRVFAPGVQELTLPVRIITIPGMDLSSAFLINPASITPPEYTLPEYTFNVQSMGATSQSIQSMITTLDKWKRDCQAPLYFSQVPGQAFFNSNAVKIWNPKVRADVGERCRSCENSLICNTEEVCPVVCVDCKRRYFMYNEAEVETLQICLGFDWEKSKKDYQCDRCRMKIGLP